MGPTPGFSVLEETDTLASGSQFPQTPALSDGQFSVMVDMTGVSGGFSAARHRKIWAAAGPRLRCTADTAGRRDRC